jgi:DNA-binding winged helix-turn-helix (wHTH) protein
MTAANIVYEFSGRRVDPARRQLLHGGKPVVMFPRCFDALLLLIEHRGQLLDKDFLLQSLWPNVVVDENSLAKVISEVRRALGEGPKSQGCIVTVARHGYRFLRKLQSSSADVFVASSQEPRDPLARRAAVHVPESPGGR